MGGQLYYREFAHFEQQVREGTTALLPPFVVYHMLAQCDSVQQVVDTLQQQVTLLHEPMLGTVPSLHWAFSDSTGEMAVIEPDSGWSAHLPQHRRRHDQQSWLPVAPHQPAQLRWSA